MYCWKAVTSAARCLITSTDLSWMLRCSLHTHCMRYSATSGPSLGCIRTSEQISLNNQPGVGRGSGEVACCNVVQFTIGGASAKGLRGTRHWKAFQNGGDGLARRA